MVLRSRKAPTPIRGQDILNSAVNGVVSASPSAPMHPPQSPSESTSNKGFGR